MPKSKVKKNVVHTQWKLLGELEDAIEANDQKLIKKIRQKLIDTGFKFPKDEESGQET